ncbi:hypothetical protein HMPREF3034_02665 [Prevotella sp. DNF00663]|nr:hypothetical protein HMPREF3034_02665 [Prevotella sp. DNF00663]
MIPVSNRNHLFPLSFLLLSFIRASWHINLSNFSCYLRTYYPIFLP